MMRQEGEQYGDQCSEVGSVWRHHLRWTSLWARDVHGRRGCHPLGEQYLTDVVAIAVAEQQRVAHVTVAEAQEILGVNTHAELAHLETLLRQRQQG